ncbi:hypothetical protein AOLI_G00250070 [Acnodon oligacanthus]
MMCEVMPTINEGDSVSSQRGSQNGSDPESNFEQLMVNMLDERDKLLESLRETQEALLQSQAKLQDALHERDALQRQINSALPQRKHKVGRSFYFTFTARFYLSALHIAKPRSALEGKLMTQLSSSAFGGLQDTVDAGQVAGGGRWSVDIYSASLTALSWPRLMELSRAFVRPQRTFHNGRPHTGHEFDSEDIWSSGH